MTVTQQAFDRLTEKLRLTTPVIAVYDTAPAPVFEPMVTAKGRACCFAYYGRWTKGETLVIARDESGSFIEPTAGCPGLQSAVGFRRAYPPWMANFLTDGKGAPMGEGLKATPALAQEYIDRARPPQPSTGYVLMGPLKVDQWEHVRAVTFLADPDRLSALLTLASYWTSASDEAVAPFSSGCGLMWRELINFDRDRAVIGCTDIAMRKYIPSNILALSVSPARFAQMLQFPDECFLNREWWNDLLAHREKNV